MTPWRLAARTVALVAVTALSCSLWAACADAATSSAMACCKDGELACAPHGGASDCCATDAARPHDAVTRVKADPVSPLHVVVTRVVAPGVGGVDTAQTRTGPPASRPLIEPGPPPYLAFSSLLI